MEHGGHAISESAIRRVRILGWLTVAIGVAPYIAILPLIMMVTTSPSQGPGAFLDGIACGLALVVAPVTLFSCLIGRGLFHHRPWARWLTLILTALGFVSILLFCVVLAMAYQQTANQPENVFEYEAFEPETKQFVTKREPRYSGPPPRELFLQKVRLTILCVVLVALLSYCCLAQVWLWKRSVRVLFRNSTNTESPGVLAV